MEAYSKSFQDIETIEMILNEANAYNLRNEVICTADFLMNICKYTEINAYQQAFYYEIYFKPTITIKKC